VATRSLQKWLQEARKSDRKKLAKVDTRSSQRWPQEVCKSGCKKHPKVAETSTQKWPKQAPKSCCKKHPIVATEAAKIKQPKVTRRSSLQKAMDFYEYIYTIINIYNKNLHVKDREYKVDYYCCPHQQGIGSREGVGTAPSLDAPLLVTSCICHDRYDCWGDSVK
jgi:hypothetical protein